MKKIKINNFEDVVYHEILDNKMKVYILPMPHKKTYFALLGVNYGGAHTKFKVDGKEYKTSGGIAHFLEHKMFEQEISPFEFFGKSGTDVNASTTADTTSYYFFGNENFEENLKYLLNWIRNLKINKKQVEKEKGIILEEARMYEDNPERELYELSNYNIFINHTYKDRIIGTHESIQNITKEEIELCYKSFYRPDNMMLVLAGPINVEETIKIIKDNFKDYNNPKEKIEIVQDEEPDNVYKEYEEIPMETSITKISLSYKMNKDIFKDLNLSKYELDYYLNLIVGLGLGKTSDFLEELYKKELYTSAFYNIFDTDDHYMISFYADTQKPNELIDKLDAYIKDIKVDKDNFIRLIKTWIASEIKITDSPRTLGYNVFTDVAEYNEYKNNKIEDIRSLSYETMLEVMKRLNFDNKSVLIICPKESNK